MAEKNVNNNDNKAWITISVAGATAGAIVAAITFATTTTATGVLATSSGFSIEMLGEAVGMGANYFVGPASGYTAKVVTKAFAKSTEQTMKTSGLVTAGVISSVAGAVTALSVTAGEHMLNYSIEYGGKISKEIAIKLSEAYLKYKMKHTNFLDTGDLSEFEMENEWILIENETDETDE
jgi:hypothetical protein